MLRTLSYVVFVAGALMLGGMASAVTANHVGAGPNVSITSGFESKSAQYTLTGQVDDSSPIIHLSYSVSEGPTHSLSPASKFKASITLKQGQNNILVKAVDEAGRQSSAMIVINYWPEESPGALVVSAKGRAALRKQIDRRMHAMREELAKEASPPTTQSAAESVKALNSSVADLKKTLASLGASTVPAPESKENSAVASNKKSPPAKPIYNTAPVIEILSPNAATSADYLLAGKTIDDAGISHLSVSLNKGESRAVKLDHGSFRVPLKLKPGTNLIQVSVVDTSDYSATRQLRVAVAPPSSRQLIDLALSKGKIGKSKALMYKVFAAFGDPRLPTKYRGYDPGASDIHILDRVAARFQTLPIVMQKKLAPFFLPPYYQGSWFDRKLFPRGGATQVAARNAPAYRRRDYTVTPAVFIRRLPASGEKPLTAGTSYDANAATVKPEARETAFAFETVGETDHQKGLPPCERLIAARSSDCKRSAHWHYVDGVHVRIWYLPKPFPLDTKKIEGSNDWQSVTDIRKNQPDYYRKHDIGVWKAQAMQLRDEYDSRIWPTLTKLMRHEPLSDARILMNGGDGRLDIALIPGVLGGERYEGLHFGGTPSFLGLTIGYLDEDTCGPHNVYIVLRRSLPFATLKSDAAHEFMHAIQASFPTQGCWDNYSWLEESTAVWAQDYVYRKVNWEHFMARDFIKSPEVPLNLGDYDNCAPFVHRKFYQFWKTKACPQHKYWSYLFFFYLRWHFKDPDLIRMTWQAAANEDSGVRAAADAIKKIHKKLDDVFPDFTVLNLNDGPIQNYYHWDHIEARADLNNISVPLKAAGDVAIPFMSADAPLKHLTAKHFFVDLYAEKARSIAVYNGYSYKLSARTRPKVGLVGPVPVDAVPVNVLALDALPKSRRHGRAIEAVVNLHGKWLKSAKDGKPYARLGPGLMLCRKASDKNDALVLVPSNSRLPGDDDTLGPVGKPPQVWVSNIGCGPWTGTITAADNGGDSSRGQWKFVTKFTTGQNVQQTSPMFTDAQLEKADSTGAPPPATSFGFVASYSGKNIKHIGIWPLGSYMLQYFGAVMSFGTGTTTWTVNNSACAYSGSGSYKVVVVLLTYNFVPQGKMYRHMMLAMAPEAYLLHPLSTDKAGLPYMEQESPSKCHMARRSDLPIQPLFGEMTSDGIHAFGKVSGSQYEGGSGGSEYFNIALKTGSGKK